MNSSSRPDGITEQQRQYLQSVKDRYNGAPRYSMTSQGKHWQARPSMASSQYQPERVLAPKCYIVKKTVVAIVLVFSLTLTNVSQIRQMLENTGYTTRNTSFWVLLSSLLALLVLEVLVALDLTFLGISDNKGDSGHQRALFFNNLAVVLVFFIAILSGFAVAFGIAYPPEIKRCTDNTQTR